MFNVFKMKKRTQSYASLALLVLFFPLFLPALEASPGATPWETDSFCVEARLIPRAICFCFHSNRKEVARATSPELSTFGELPFAQVLGGPFSALGMGYPDLGTLTSANSDSS